MKILVVGATGQLGYTIVKKLIQTTNEVYAFHRKSSNIAPLKKLKGLNLVEGDLIDPDSLEKAVKGMEVVISTANTATPVHPDDSFKDVDLKGLCGRCVNSTQIL